MANESDSNRSETPRGALFSDLVPLARFDAQRAAEILRRTTPAQLALATDADLPASCRPLGAPGARSAQSALIDPVL